MSFFVAVESAKLYFLNHSFVMTAVTGDFGEEISSMYRLAVIISAPLELRLERIRQRTYSLYGERVLPGGDMYGQDSRFIHFVFGKSEVTSLIKKDKMRQVHAFFYSFSCTFKTIGI